MSVFQNINLPEINSASDMKKVKNYLAQMDENIRYAIENIDEENITKKFIDDLTVRHLNITNGDNSIIGNPDVGFQMLKGTKNQLSFDINTGEATFGGNIIGGSIQSDNYIKDEYENLISGMRINLEDGSLEAPGFGYINGVLRVRSELEEMGGKYVLTMNDGQSTFSVFYYYMDVLEGSCTLSHNGIYCSDPSIYAQATYDNYGIEITKGYENYILVANEDNFVYKGWRVITGDILNSFETELKQWVTNNFVAI